VAVGCKFEEVVAVGKMMPSWLAVGGNFHEPLQRRVRREECVGKLERWGVIG
jgi:hypothetical protein